MEPTEDDFYGDLEKGNAVLYQQGQNNIMLALTGQVTQLISAGEDPDKIKDLMSMLKEMKGEIK